MCSMSGKPLLVPLVTFRLIAFKEAALDPYLIKCFNILDNYTASAMRVFILLNLLN